MHRGLQLGERDVREEAVCEVCTLSLGRERKISGIWALSCVPCVFWERVADMLQDILTLSRLF